MLRATGHARMVSSSTEQFNSEECLEHMLLVGETQSGVWLSQCLMLSHVGAFCLRQNAQRAALRAAGQATSGMARVWRMLKDPRL